MLRFSALAMALLPAVLLSPCAQGEEYQVACPPAVSGDALKSVQAPEGWTAYVPGPFWLHSAGPMDGPPAEMAVLKEASYTKRSGNKTVRKWNLRGAFTAGKWMACNYGYANDIYLSRRLDDRTSECTVTRVGRASGKIDIDIRCKR